MSEKLSERCIRFAAKLVSWRHSYHRRIGVNALADWNAIRGELREIHKQSTALEAENERLAARLALLEPVRGKDRLPTADDCVDTLEWDSNSASFEISPSVEVWEQDSNELGYYGLWWRRHWRQVGKDDIWRTPDNTPPSLHARYGDAPAPTEEDT
jgi:hypothetical protein